MNRTPETFITDRLPARTGGAVRISIESQPEVALTAGMAHCEALLAYLSAQPSDSPIKVLLFIGVASGVGTSTTVANVAALIARTAESKVLLIRANFRSSQSIHRPHAAIGREAAGINLAQLFAVPGGFLYPEQGPSNLYVLPSGPAPQSPVSLFESSTFDRLLTAARDHFRYVLIDAAPLPDYPESRVLSGKADGVILVAEAEKTRKQIALRAKQQVEIAGGNILGVVLNKRRYYIPAWLYKRL